jgi:hypothetical protein
MEYLPPECTGNVSPYGNRNGNGNDIDEKHEIIPNHIHQQQLKLEKNFFIKNNDILTIKRNHNDLSVIIDESYNDAMQILRIHLLEREQINDLCRDFCQRYIAGLKVKLNANNIVPYDDESFNSIFTGSF